MLTRSRLLRPLGVLFDAAVRRVTWSGRQSTDGEPVRPASRRRLDLVWTLLVIAVVVASLWNVLTVLVANTTVHEALGVFLLGLITMLRVFVLILLASLVWVPIGVWVGMRPAAAQIVQPIAQFLAAFPANLLFPVTVYVIVTWNLNADIWLSPLMILGTQWYILFNVIAGARAIPTEFRYVSQNLGVGGWLWWRRVALPGVMPYYVTGAITASGGSWNAAIVAELANWGGTRVRAHGLGTYIAEATASGDFHRIVLGIATMSIFVVAINRALWRPVYYFAERKFRLE
jgi:NitT/TauT family transport system permease protein